MGNELYDNRPINIMRLLEQFVKPFGYVVGYNNVGDAFTIKRGAKSIRCPYFFKDRRGRINMKLKLRNGDTWIKCIDKESDKWLAYYAYKEIICNNTY